MPIAYLTDHAERPIGQIVSEVVAVGILVNVQRMVVLVEAVRLVKVGEPVEDPVETVEPRLQRPAVLWTSLGQSAVRAQVPLTDHEAGPSGASQHLPHGHRVGTDRCRVAGEARLHVTDGAHPGQMVVQPGQQGRPGR
jgi:hypothetical protein